ncbi:TPA: hypothetical protein PMK43_002050 [Vibrio cholerae]|nr:hypothetical protein [Vibrio cholerae]
MKKKAAIERHTRNIIDTSARGRVGQNLPTPTELTAPSSQFSQPRKIKFKSADFSCRFLARFSRTRRLWISKNRGSSMQEHIHHISDGRGKRKIFVNGNEIRYVIYADTKKGIVKYHPHPVRLKKGTDEVYTRTLKGVVTVEFIK